MVIVALPSRGHNVEGCVKDGEVLGLTWNQMHQHGRIILKLDFLHVNKWTRT